MASSYKTIGDRLGRGELAIYYDYTQDVRNNRSYVTITGIYFASTVGWGNYFGDGVITISGDTSFSVNYTNDSSSGCYCSDAWDYQPLGNKSFGSFYVTHDSSGNGSFSIRVGPRSGSGYSDFNVFCSQGTYKNAEWSQGTSYQSLPKIDRTAPTVSLTASAASASSISISGTASVNCDSWDYSVDNGSWYNFSSVNGTSASGTITGLSAGTHTVKIRARKNSNYVYGTSGSVSVDTAPPTITPSVSNIGSSGFTISATSNVTCNIWDYSLDNGSTWTRISTTEGTSTSVTVTGLSPNTTYNVKVRARKKANNIYGTSSAVSAKTLGGSVLNTVYNFAADDATVAVKLNVTVYGTFYHRLHFKDTNGTLIATVQFSLSARTASDITLNLPASSRSLLLNAMPNVKTMQVDLTLETYADSGYQTLIGSSGPKRCTMTTSAANSSPVFTSFTYNDTETAVTAVTQNNQILVQFYSHLLVNVTAGTAINGASVTGYSVTIGDVSVDSPGTGTSIDVGQVSSSGTLTLRVTCSDSRGYYTSVEKTVTVLQYAQPTLSSFTLRRRNEIGKLIQLTFNGFVSSLPVSSVEKNALVSVILKYKQTSASTWTSINLTSAVTKTGLFFSYTNLELMELDETQSFDFMLIVTDNLGTLSQLEYAVILNQGTPLLAFRKRSATNNRPRVGVNNPEPVYELDVHGDIAMHDIVVQGFVAELNEEYLNNIKAGGYYMQFDAAKVLTNRNYPVASKPGLLEVLAGASGSAVQRYTLFDCSAVYIRYFAGSGSWSSWRAI